MGRSPWQKYSFSLALILPQILGQKFLQIGIKTKTKQKNNNELSLGVGSGPASLGSQSLGCPHLLPGRHSISAQSWAR